MSRLVVSNIETQNIKFDPDTTAFTIGSDGVLSGTGSPAMVKLLDATISSVAQYDIDSTYINSTYDTYKIIANLVPASDGPDLYTRVFVGGSVQTGSIYGYEGFPMDGGSVYTADSTTFMRHNRYAVGSASGEAISIEGTLMSVNSTTIPFSFVGFSHYNYTSALPSGNPWTCGLKASNASDVVNGLRLYFSSGNIESGNVQLYGIK